MSTTSLQGLVADLQVLAFEAQEAHWNVYGPFFGPLHALFGTLYEFFLDTQDTVAERIRALKYTVAAGTAKSSLKTTSLVGAAPKAMLTALCTDMEATYEAMCGLIKKFETSDPVTSNLLQDTAGKLDKYVWMVRMHTADKP